MYRQMTCKLKWILLFYPFVGSAQNSVKTPQEYAQQKAIANSILPKSNLTSTVDIPDLQSLSALDKSGDANISIPVVNVKGRKLTLPISLSYNTNGIKVQQSASEVGLGWSINFGSIIRDYGAYEPDYTYTGSEFKMLYWGNTTGVPTSTDEQINPSGYDVINPHEHNKVFKYDGIDGGYAPDEYIISVPGLQSNSFWNYNATGSPTSPVNFVFTENIPWKIGQEAADFSFPQEMSRINELDYMPIPNTSPVVLDNSHNFAAAIGFYPYVKNYSFPKYIGFFNNPVIQGPIDVGTITYNDYSKFTITTNDGTKYIFGKPLRGQKYLISDEPFWSTMNRNQFTEPGNSNMANSLRKSYGEFWKTDYIAEWLLTEVRSADYVDLNGNGPDAADGGDWIKIDYTQNYKQWLNFTQTDKASSLFREKAYVSSITTPIQQINFSTELRNDIDMDHFASVFNRINQDYVYNNARINVYGTNIYLDAKHPIEERAYTGAEVKQIAEGITTVQNITFNYATPGAPEELAKSNYYIMDINSNYNSYDPSSLGGGLTLSGFYHNTAKGKKTLLGLTIKGNNTASINKIEYGFTYSNNATYDNVAIFKILSMGAFPIIRESISSMDERWGGSSRTINSNGRAIAHSMAPWKWIQIGASKSVTYGENTSPKLNSSTGMQVDYQNDIVEDEFGYRSNIDLNTGEYQFNRNAWCLSEIKLPYGGIAKFTYENDECDIVNDRNKWPGVRDFALPSVAHYNNLAHMRSIKQATINSNKHLYREFYFLMNEKSGGLRVKKLDFLDPYNSIVTSKTYNYGIGHFSAPPADYLQNYINSYGSFMNSEMLRHRFNEIYEDEYTIVIPFTFNEFTSNMSRLVISNRIDNSLKRLAQHYYEYIDEVSADGAKTRSHYGRMIPSNDPLKSEAQNRLLYYEIKNNAVKGEYSDRYNFVEVLAIDNDLTVPLGNYKTELFDKNGSVINTVANHYEFIDFEKYNTIYTKEQLLLTKNYLSWHPGQSVDQDLAEKAGALWSPATPPINRMYDGRINGVRYFPKLGLWHTIKEINGYNQDVILSNSESRCLYFPIGFSCGFYSGQPSWFTGLTNMSYFWQNAGLSATQMSTEFNTAVYEYSKKTSTATYIGFKWPNTNDRPHSIQEEYYVSEGIFTNLRSTILRTRSSITIMKY